MARGAHWSAEENVATVAAYLEMLTLQFRNEAYRKVDFTRRWPSRPAGPPALSSTSSAT